MLLFSCLSLSGQDIHFTQFYEPQLTLNPSNTGRFIGDWRVNANFRNQWGSIVKPYVTSAVSFDYQLQFLGQTVGLGGFYAFDQSADQTLYMNKLMLSAAWHKAIGYQQFSLGSSIGFNKRSLNYSSLSFPGQFDNTIGGFNTSFSSGESFAVNNSNYLDMNIGFNYKNRLNEKWIVEGGLSMFHFNWPSENFTSINTKVPPRYVFSGGSNYNINAKSYITGHALYMYKKKASDLLLAAHYNYRLAPNKTNLSVLFAGLAYRGGVSRNIDAIAFIFGAETKNYRYGFAYDVNVSKLSTSTFYKGAFEISLTYIAPHPTPSKYTIPCEIY